jgi:PadR family transcriptional regulator PadR
VEREWLTQARRGVIELCVLSLIAHQPRYGYQLASALADLGRPLAASEGTLYPLLRRLQREGVVDATWQESPDGPPRKYYHLSESGKTLLAAQLAEWAALTRAVDGLKLHQHQDKEVPDGTGSTRHSPLPGRAEPAPGSLTSG